MILEIYCGDDYYDDEYPSHAKVDLTIELINRILELKAALEKVGANKISDYDSSLDFCDEDGNEDDCAGDFRTDGIAMNVYQHGGVCWDANVKHTNIKIYTQEISFIELAEIRKTLTTPEDELPLLIGNVKSKEAKAKLTERLSSNG